jgi:hypothetical protein
MQPSADLCRIQEAFQRRRAESTPLGNVRSIAEKAAAAWGVEAILAEGREERQARVRLFREDELDRKRLAQEQLDQGISENPDRGCADAVGVAGAVRGYSTIASL